MSPIIGQAVRYHPAAETQAGLICKVHSETLVDVVWIAPDGGVRTATEIVFWQGQGNEAPPYPYAEWPDWQAAQPAKPVEPAKPAVRPPQRRAEMELGYTRLGPAREDS